MSASTERYLKLSNALGDSEINLLIFRICLSGLNSLNGAYLEAVGSNFGVVHCADGASLNNPTDYTFHARSYYDLN